MEVIVQVDPDDAVCAGKLVSGNIPVALTPEFLDGLTKEEREELAKAIGVTQTTSGGSVTHLPDHPHRLGSRSGEDPAEATLEAVKTILVQRVAEATAKKAQEAEKEAQRQALIAEAIAAFNTRTDEDIRKALGNNFWFDRAFGYSARPYRPNGDINLSSDHPDLQDYVARVRRIIQKANEEKEARREAEEEVIRARRQAEEEATARYYTALVTWITSHGTESQKARQAAGVLDEKEVLAAIRADLFAPLAQFPTYERMHAGDVEHENGCLGEATFRTTPKMFLSDVQFVVVEGLRANLPAATIEARTHIGKCTECDIRATERQSVLVTMDFHGRPLSREYALPDDEPIED